MVHFSCDLCGKELLPESDRRYVVKMEVYAAADPNTLNDDDLDQDHLEALGEYLQDLEASGSPHNELPPDYKQFRLDLCSECHKKFLRDPLNKEAAKFDFSEN
ncbi:MAG: hypothetical protein N2039_08580 [Gemmataceae bacterium]|nr:hypothetical protein [Gemmataceae bacterium]